MKKINTKLVQSGKHTHAPEGIDFRTINPPIYKGSTVLFDDYESYSETMLRSELHGTSYGTYGTPTQIAFEEAMAQIEGGFKTRAFISGLNAIDMTLLAFLKAGDHILVCENVYGPGAAFCRKVLPKYQIESTFIPAAVGSSIEKYIKQNTRLILLESPGSDTFELQDIPAITTIAKQKNILTVLDNTWATPLYFKPFDKGIDVSIHSVTKYISGHSDVLMGTATVTEKHYAQFHSFYETLELFASSETCYLALRGLRTLGVRLKHHEQSALEIANWLNEQDQVETVLHPALTGHPQHEIWERDYLGSSGVFGFILKTDYSINDLGRFFDGLNVFEIGLSWGGYKSLIKAGVIKGRENVSPYNNRTVFRLSIGFEDSKDLIDDLENGFSKLIS
jgi:cystathionine beta-lyase